MRSLSVVIPAFNEQERIVPTIEQICDYLKIKQIEFEVIVVDDGSTDNTVNIVKNLNQKNVRIIEFSYNRGKGAAVKVGMLNAQKSWVLFSDADLSTPIDELERFFDHLKRYNVLIGSRAVKGADIKESQPFYRVLLGKIFNFMVQILATPGIWDTQCGFKLFSKPAVDKIFNNVSIEGFGFDVEALFLADKFGFKVKELPVRWINSKGSKVNPVKDSWRMFKDLFKINFNNFSGKYD